MNSTRMEEVLARIDNIEKRKEQEFVTLLEILSNVTFFGGIKKTNCEYANDGQCGLFYLQSEAKNKIPVATECRIPGCVDPHTHCHMEISNVTCAFCPQWNSGHPVFKSNKQNTSRRKNKR